jgi:hypothetical protein
LASDNDRVERSTVGEGGGGGSQPGKYGELGTARPGVRGRDEGVLRRGCEEVIFEGVEGLEGPWV